jgi:hypothetical protein
MNEALRRVNERLIADPGDVPFVACDHSCACVSATGMAPNGGCRCDERKLRQAVRYWRRRAQFLQVTIQIMRGDPSSPYDEAVPSPSTEKDK